MPAISVIMPMYKAKKTAMYSIDALLNQTFKDIEVLVVDDCSPDDSYVVVKEHYKDEPRVVLIRQDINQGPAEARNRAFEEAKGEYVTFLDSDDGIIKEGLEKMYEAAKKFDADVVHTTGCFFPVHKPDVMDIMSVPKENYLPQDKDKDIPGEATLLTQDFGVRLSNWLNGTYNGNVWGKMIKKSFIMDNNIRFASIKMSEDVLFSFECLMRAGKYVILPYKCIIYRMIGESLSRGRKDVSYMLKLLEATFSGNDKFTEKMNEIPYFKDNPEDKEKVLKYVNDVMDMIYLVPAFQSVGEDKLLCDDRTSELFIEHFGNQAQFALRCFFMKNAKEPPAPSYLIDDITYEGLNAQLEMYKQSLK
ncbi:glycosyltransferase [Butyrivibrio fibrisolvens]|jgi:glycosyltransferase involved in cell wall biosynthesis|uniref:Glycosyltransferase family 2 protein n=2 Tax=Butyrivibrio fibrisolvens TaxID=831 RepID=A0A317G775_BUTFI|nr:glycosyltransferase family 2 protein [Butyrivibrio fibrisolvens]PWT28603.1 glycosyltransferase family 2 protein [Butyrivibrio fibrisolvens]SHI27397.1 Glycosyl transferase family 2 [Butyrivibrio fibrisolvens DSM 3071]